MSLEHLQQNKQESKTTHSIQHHGYAAFQNKSLPFTKINISLNNIPIWLTNPSSHHSSKRHPSYIAFRNGS
jgi:hypothetical protein